MRMGFGYNAYGVIGCRIVDSSRECLIAILTNNFVSRDGHFPIPIVIITMFFVGAVGGAFQSVVPTLMLTGVIMLGVFMTLMISRLFSKTILKGMPSLFNLEFPPYRRLQVGKVIARFIFDRMLSVLGRIVVVAVPTGLAIWVLANVSIGDTSILAHYAASLDPFARLMGPDGYTLMALILGFSANEIAVPIIIMSYTATGSLTELESLSGLHILPASHGWTWLMAVCAMPLCLLYWPCGAICLTAHEEMQSLK